MDAIDCIMTRTSVRVYSGTKVSEQDLLKICKAGMAAPSAINLQPWSFIILNDEDTLDELANVLPHCKMLPLAGKGIVVCGVIDKDPVYAKEYWVYDCSAVTQNILLAAHALGFGAVWTAVYPDEKKVKDVKKILSLPENIIPLAVIPIGVPSGKQIIKDKFKKENIHYNKW